MLRSVSSLLFLEKVHSDLPELRGLSLEGNLSKPSFEGTDENVSISLVVPRNRFPCIKCTSCISNKMTFQKVKFVMFWLLNGEI